MILREPPPAPAIIPWRTDPIPMLRAVELVTQSRAYFASEQGRRLLEERIPRTIYDGQEVRELDPRGEAEAFVGGLAGDLYWITAPMLQLVEHGARTLPDESLERSDLPAHSGVALFATPMVSCDFQTSVPMVGWGWYAPGGPAAPGVICIPVLDRDAHRAPGQLAPALLDILFPHSLDTIPFGRGTIVPPELASANDFWRRWALRAFWILCQQRLARVTTPALPRAARRRAARAGQEIPTLKVVTLRRLEGAAAAIGTTEVEWSHRWIVNGHWRNQWLPSRQLHRQQWIDPYVKGPEDRPLVLKDTVHALAR